MVRKATTALLPVAVDRHMAGGTCNGPADVIHLPHLGQSADWQYTQPRIGINGTPPGADGSTCCLQGARAHKTCMYRNTCTPIAPLLLGPHAAACHPKSTLLYKALCSQFAPITHSLPGHSSSCADRLLMLLPLLLLLVPRLFTSPSACFCTARRLVMISFSIRFCMRPTGSHGMGLTNTA